MVRVFLLVALALQLQPQASLGQSTSCRPGSAGCAGTDNSCRFAYDHECDEPDLCRLGTDSADCLSEAPTSSSSRRRRSSGPATRSTDEDGIEEYEDEEEAAVGSSGLDLLVSLTLLLVLLFFPCIVFGVAWCTCIAHHNSLGA